MPEKRLRDRLTRHLTHSPAEIDHIVDQVHAFRLKFRARPYPFRYAQHTVCLSVLGFCPTIQRNTMLWALRAALAPKLLYAANVKPNNFESILVLTVREGTFHHHFADRIETPILPNGARGQPQHVSRVDALIEDIQAFLDLFRVSATVMDLVSWGNPSTVSCVRRIEEGTFSFGNLWHTSNRWLLYSYQNNLRRMEDAAFPSPGVARAFGTNPASSMRRRRAFANGASRISRTARSICDHVLSTEASGGSSAGPESVSARTCSARNAVELIFRLEPFETTVHSSSPMVPPARCRSHARAQPSGFTSPGRAVGCAPPHARPRLAH